MSPSGTTEKTPDAAQGGRPHDETKPAHIVPTLPAAETTDNKGTALSLTAETARNSEADTRVIATLARN